MVRWKIGIRDYSTYFEKRKIKENETYALTTKEGLEFYVNNDKTLTWTNTFTKEKLRNNGIKDLDNINPRKVLTRKKWYVEKR